jgi:hypothetical protein
LNDPALDLRGVVTDLPIELHGGWSPTPAREWRGAAAAPEPLVALALLRRGGVLRWARTGADGRDAPALPLRLSLLPYDRAGRHVQVVLEVGHAQVRDGCTVPSPAYRPSLADTTVARTGHPIDLAAIDGAEPINLAALFLARRDATFARNGIWHLRPALAARLDEATARLLTRGRTGRLVAGGTL